MFCVLDWHTLNTVLFGCHRDGPRWIKKLWVCCFLSKRVLSDPTPSRLRRCMAADLPKLQPLEQVQLLASTSYMSLQYCHYWAFPNSRGQRVTHASVTAGDRWFTWPCCYLPRSCEEGLGRRCQWAVQCKRSWRRNSMRNQKRKKYSCTNISVSLLMYTIFLKRYQSPDKNLLKNAVIDIDLGKLQNTQLNSIWPRLTIWSDPFTTVNKQSWRLAISEFTWHSLEIPHSRCKGYSWIEPSGGVHLRRGSMDEFREYAATNM